MNININQDLRQKSVAFLTLGCKVNSYETEAMQKLFEEAGLTVVDFSQKADIYVVNTCTVTNIADRKSRQMLHKARKMNDEAVVVAVGCYVQAAKEALEEDNTIDLVIGNNRKKDIISILKEYYEGNTKNRNVIMQSEIKPEGTFDSKVPDIGLETEYEDLSIDTVSEKTRAYIKIQDGCNQFCSYCIIPYARGRVRSRSEQAIMEEVSNIVKKGYKEIVLTGIHLSSYGIDFEKKSEKEALIEAEEGINKHHLLELIIKLSKINDLERIRLGSLEPRIITEEFAKTLSSNHKLCPHFHLSLQSGCDATLKRMNRKYTAEEYYEKCKLLRQYFQDPAITTDVIVGFPGETEEEFQETEKFLRKISFAKMHIFKYSVRRGTKAEHMPDQVKEEVKTERSSRLMELEEEMSREYQDLFRNRVETILIEETMKIDGNVYQVGHNERYIKLAVSADKDYHNQLIKGKIISNINKDIMFCEIMD